MRAIYSSNYPLANNIDMDTLLNILFGFFYILWRIAHLFLSGIWKLMTDVTRGVYGKFVTLIVGIVFIALLGGIASLFQIHL